MAEAIIGGFGEYPTTQSLIEKLKADNPETSSPIALVGELKLPVKVNVNIIETSFPNQPRNFRDFLQMGLTFTTPGEDINAIKSIASKIDLNKGMVTVVGSAWPAFWRNLGVQKVVGIDINYAQMFEYEKSLTNNIHFNDRLITDHKSGLCPLLLDDITKLGEDLSKKYITGSNVFLSNIPEYVSTEELTRVIGNILMYMTPGTHILMSHMRRSSKISTEDMSSAVNRSCSLVAERLGKGVKLQTNLDFGLPAENPNPDGIRLDHFYVVSTTN